MVVKNPPSPLFPQALSNSFCTISPGTRQKKNLSPKGQWINASHFWCFRKRKLITKKTSNWIKWAWVNIFIHHSKWMVAILKNESSSYFFSTSHKRCENLLLWIPLNLIRSISLLLYPTKIVYCIEQRLFVAFKCSVYQDNLFVIFHYAQSRFY